MHLLKAANALDDSSLLALLHDPAAGVREGALRLSETRLKDDAAVRQAVIEKADDNGPRVRFQCALSLGASPVPEIPALTRIAKRDSGDEWTRAGILSSTRDHASELAVEV